MNGVCSQWEMDINEAKTKVVHFRKKSVNVTNVQLRCGKMCIDVIPDYLGLWFNQHLDTIHAAREIAKSVTRALGAVIVKFKALGSIS